MGFFTMLLARRKHRYGFLVSLSPCKPFLFSPRNNVTGVDSSAASKPEFITFAVESLRFRGNFVRAGVRDRHRHHHGDSHVPIAEPSWVRLHGAREVCAHIILRINYKQKKKAIKSLQKQVSTLCGLNCSFVHKIYLKYNMSIFCFFLHKYWLDRYHS